MVHQDTTTFVSGKSSHADQPIVAVVEVLHRKFRRHTAIDPGALLSVIGTYFLTYPCLAMGRLMPLSATDPEPTRDYPKQMVSSAPPNDHNYLFTFSGLVP